MEISSSIDSHILPVGIVQFPTTSIPRRRKKLYIQVLEESSMPMFVQMVLCAFLPGKNYNSYLRKSLFSILSFEENINGPFPNTTVFCQRP
jgi:hypothetical protein